MNENRKIELDEEGRVIFRLIEEEGVLREWCYCYDEDGNQKQLSYYEEISNEANLYTDYL